MSKYGTQLKIAGAVGLLAFSVMMFILAFSSGEKSAKIPNTSSSETVCNSTAQTVSSSKSSAAGAQSETAAADSTTQYDDFPIDINTADAETLQNIPGIGSVKANSIVEYRNEHGKFRNAEELLNVDGIGESTLDKIYGYICVK